MIKRELKVNLKAFLIWTAVLVGMFIGVFLLYPYFITDDAVQSLDDMLKAFPPELLKTFNMDISSINTAYGWLKSEGFMFALIITGVYAALLGGNIVLKEEYDKTAEYLYTLPVKRSAVLTRKIAVGIFYTLLMTVVFGLANFAALELSGEYDRAQFLALSVTPILSALPLFGLNLLVSAFQKKAKKNTGLSLGMVFLFYFLSVVSELSDKVKFLRYASVYTLADTRNVIEKSSVNPVTVVISLALTAAFIAATYIKYGKKELV